MNFQDHSLTLGLGFPTQTLKTNNHNHNHHITSKKPKQEMILGDNEQPCLTLSLSSESATSLPNVVLVSSVKRERETTSSDDVDIERGSSRNISDEEEDGTCNITATRKKLRLTKDQSAMLEESFMLQNTLNPKQKQVLADRLNMRPRQVEVWFQNRRARTKSKKTEEDCEYMKKWCETLTDENMRLSKELEGLKLTQPYFMQLPTTTTLTMCPSCERIGSTVPISGTPTKSHFYAATTTSNRPLLVDN